MFSKTTLLTLCFLGLSVIPGCANPHFFPRLQPLFPGLNEAQLSSAGKNAVAKAKQDFVLVKHGESPAYARLVQADSPGGTKVYQGEGYRLTMVRKETFNSWRVGPDIVVSAAITGGHAYHYDEVDELAN